jgi:hypothetical protein
MKQCRIPTPRYDLSAVELAPLEAQLAHRTAERLTDPVVGAVWIRNDDPCANVIRTLEGRYFPEAQEVTMADEEQSMFLALMDGREEGFRLVQGATMCGVKRAFDGGPSVSLARSEGSTGFICVDQLIELGNFSREDFVDYYGSQGVDLDTCVSVETHVSARKRVPPWNGLSMSGVFYVCVFGALKASGGTVDRSLVIASINRLETRSFERVGLRFEPLMGRTDLEVPEALVGRSSLPVVIHYDDFLVGLAASMEFPLHRCML